MSSHPVVIHLHSIASKRLCESIMSGSNSCSLPLQVVLLPNCNVLLAAQLFCWQDSRFLVLLRCNQLECVCVCVCHVCQVSRVVYVKFHVFEHIYSVYHVEGMVHTACPSSHSLVTLDKLVHGMASSQVGMTSWLVSGTCDSDKSSTGTPGSNRNRCEVLILGLSSYQEHL